MRTAEQILRDGYDCEGDRQDLQIELSLNCYLPLIEKIINEARKEALEECANKTCIEDNNFHPVISKEEILNLIKEIK